eukprot:UN02349
MQEIEEYWVDEGCSVEGDDVKGKYENKWYLHGTTCCDKKDETTCIAPQTFANNCEMTEVTYAEAKEFCENNGYRLCTAEELSSDRCYR